MSGPSATISEAKEGQIMAARDRSIATATSLGPPDLCYTSRTTAVGMLRSTSYVGQAHFVHGQETSSPAAIAAYFIELAKLWPGLHHGTYCCYNAFMRADVRVDFALPGSIACYAITPSGRRRDQITSLEWHEAEVSSMLRCMLLLRKRQRTLLSLAAERDTGLVEPVVIMDPLASPKREAAFLAAAESVFGKGHLLGAPPHMVPTKCINVLTLCILDYYCSTGRPVQAEIFFSKFRPSHPDIAVLIARATDSNPRGDKKRVLALLAASLQRSTGATAQIMLIEQARMLRSAGNLEGSILIGEAASIESTAHNVQAVLTMAETYIAAKRPVMALSTLNLLDHCVATRQRATWVSREQPKAVADRGRESMLSPSMVLERKAESKGSSLAMSFRSRERAGSGPKAKAGGEAGSDGGGVGAGDVSDEVSPMNILLSTSSVREEDQTAFKIVVQASRILGRDGFLTTRNQLFGLAPSKSIEEAGLKLHPRACSPWLDHLILKLYADQITLAHWIGALAVPSTHGPQVWCAAAALALRLEDHDSAQRFLVKFRTDEKYGTVAEMALLELYLQKRDLNRTLGLLSKLSQHQEPKAYEHILFRHALFKRATIAVSIWGTNAVAQAINDLGLQSSPVAVIIDRATRLVNPGAGT